MNYKSFINPAFKNASFCYTCFSKKNKNAVLYEVNMTGHEITDKNYKLHRKGYYTYLMNFTVAGEGVMHYKGATQRIKAGDLLFINCKDEHIFYPSTDGWEFFYVHLNGLGMNFLYDNFVNATGNIYKNYPSKTFIKNLNRLHILLKGCESQRAENDMHVFINDEILCCEIAKLLYEIIVDLHKNVLSLNVEIPFALSKALDFIKVNYNKKITLEQIAKQACMSKFHFERMFSLHIGQTVYSYIKDLRFQNARWLLETTQKKVIDIAFEVGYSDIQALNKMFKKQLGVTPSEYRKSTYHY